MRRPLALLASLLLLPLLATVASRAARAAVPTGFTDALVATVGSPTAIAFTPDGRMLVASQGGVLRVYAPDTGTLLATALTFPSASICTNSERGLLGIAVHPGFASNRFVYLFYTRRNTAGNCPNNDAGGNHPVNRVSRFVLPDSNVIDSGTETVVLDNILSPAGNHNAGDINFGPDGYLYVSTGDGGSMPQTSQQLNTLMGKVLRVTDSGGVPPDNPVFTTQGGSALTAATCGTTGSSASGSYCREIYAYGFRNPFRFSLDPASGTPRLFLNDVGQSTWEEIDDIQPRGNYGWSFCEGNHNNGGNNCGALPPFGPTQPQGHRGPIFEWQHGVTVPGMSVANCHSVTGSAFVPAGLWLDSGGNPFDGAYFFGDSVCSAIGRLAFNGSTWQASDFGSGLGPVIHLEFGPYAGTRALYYATFNGGGQVRRISQGNPAANDPPTAVIGATPTSGPAPLTVTFSAAGSSDPDPGDTLTYFWSFGDGTPQQQTTNLTIQHTYPTPGAYTAQLRARDQSFAFSAPVTIQIQPGNTAPTPTIESPAAGVEFSVGQTLTLTGSATDAQDGNLPPAALSWTVLLHHDQHTHPYFSGTGNNLTVVAPAPEDLLAAGNSYLEVHLRATDSQGLFTDVQRDVQPHEVALTFATEPAGRELRLHVGSSPTTITGPTTITSWEGWQLVVEAPNQEDGGTTWVFAGWADGGGQTRTLVTPASATLYTARFEAGVDEGPLELHTVTPCRLIDTRLPDAPNGGPALVAGQVRHFTLTDGCGVPATARAVAVNLTSVAPTAQGFLAIYPAGLAGTGTSTLSLAPGRTRANNAVLLLGDGDAVAALASGASVHLIVDVVGYFE